MRKIILLLILASVLVACASAPTEPRRYGEASRSLGRRSLDFGSQEQAQELLKLIGEKPFRINYTIDYQTDEDTVLFACNFDKEVIVRIHQRPNGHGTQESWQGYVLERLESAASGGSLNDTPTGKEFGKMESF